MTDTINKSQNLSLKLESDVKGKLKRQVQLINDGSISKQEIDDAINNNDVQVTHPLIKGFGQFCSAKNAWKGLNEARICS